MPTQHLAPLTDAACHPLVATVRRLVGDNPDLGEWHLARRDADPDRCVAAADVAGVPGGVVTVWRSRGAGGRWSVQSAAGDAVLWFRNGVPAADLAGAIDEAAGVVFETAAVAA